MYNKTDKQYDQLEKMEVFYKEMENNQFEDDFERRRDIDYWKSDKTLRSVLSEQQELLVAEKQGQEELMNSMCVELKRLRKICKEKEGERS